MMTTNKTDYIRRGNYCDVRHDYAQTINIATGKAYARNYGLAGAEMHNIIADAYWGLDINGNQDNHTDTDGEQRNYYEDTICQDSSVGLPGDNPDDIETSYCPDHDSILYFRACYTRHNP